MGIGSNNSGIEISQDTLQIVSKTPMDTTHIKHGIILDTLLAKKPFFISDSSIKVKQIRNHAQEVKPTLGLKPTYFISVKPDSESLVSNTQGILWGNSGANNTCYIVGIKKEKNISRVFGNDKQLTANYVEKGLEIKERNPNHLDWSFIPVFLGLLILATLVAFYRKLLIQLLEKIIYRLKLSKSSNEKSIPFKRLTLLLDVLFIISFSLLVDRATIELGLYAPPSSFEYFIFIMLLGFLVLLRIFRWTIFHLLATISSQKNFIHDLFNNSTLYTRTLGVFLLPSVFLILYTPGSISKYLIYFSLLSVIIVLIIRIIRILKVFVDFGFSIFYFILYLCALEIAPLLIIWKEVVSR